VPSRRPAARPVAPGRLLAAARAGAFEVIACPQVFDEFRRGLEKPYFRSRLTTAEADELLEAFELLALVLPDPDQPESVVRDPNDDYLVALANTANAVAIVSGDRDLLDHHELRPPALDARTACELLGLLP
jgi:uncharacterized protein